MPKYKITYIVEAESISSAIVDVIFPGGEENPRTITEIKAEAVDR